MNPLPDAFEWKLLRQSLIGLCVFFFVILLAALLSELWPGQVANQQSGLILGARLGALLATALALGLAWGLPANSPRLYPLALTTLGLNFLASLSAFFWANGDLIVAQGAFLLIGAIYLLLLGFFSQRQWITVAFGTALVVVAWAIFVQWPQNFFRLVMTPDEASRSMAIVLFFGLPALKFLVFLNNQSATTLMTRARESAAKLAQLAYFDAETDLPNGRHLEKDLAEWNPQSLRPEDKIVLAGFRLDGLDALNELRGLEYTTLLLKRVATAYGAELTRALDDNPLYRGPGEWKSLYRVEGAAFAFPFTIPPGTKADTSPMQVLLDAVLREENQNLTKGTPLQFHGGFTVFPDDSPDHRHLVGNLLNLLHSNRSSAKGEFQPFNVAHYQEFVRKESIKNALGEALENQEFTVVFQPKVALSDGSLTGFEALSRWKSPTLGHVSPAEFIGLAEQTGMIDSMTKFLLGNTATMIRALRSQGLKDFRISINLSPGLLNQRFLVALHDHWQENGLARFLELEITEGILMVLDPSIQNLFQRIRSLGITFSIDDFGTGYSNLGYLQNFEAEVLKVDKRFIDGIPHDEKNTKLVRAILQMAQSLGMKVVAEGVEYREQRDFLASVGCDQIQGYFYSKPLLVREALEFPHKVG